MKDVLDFFNLKNQGSNFQTVKARILTLELDCSHFLKRTDSSNLSRAITKEEFIKNWLTEDSNKERKHLKRYLLKFEIMEYFCSECGLGEEWNNKKLVLQLEHKNGKRNDNRVENLCFLCPNCHSQTDTYAGRKNKLV